VNLGVSITLLLIVFGFLFQNKLFFCIQLLWLMIISGFNTNSADWINNFETYQVASSDYIHSSGIPTGLYNCLAVIAKSIGIDYVSFNGILTSISTLLIAYVIWKMAKKPTLVISLIYIYPFIDDIIQKRWYYAMGILVFGVYKSLNAKNKVIRAISLLVSAFIAYQFHSGAILFFTLPLYLMLSVKTQNIVTIITIIIGTIGRNSISNLVNIITNNSLTEKSNLYFSILSANSTITHYLFWAIWQFMQAGIIFYIYKKRKPFSDDVSKVWRVNVWAMCLIPLYSFDPVFSRMFRVVLIFNYIIITNNLWLNKKELLRVGIIALFYQIVFSIISLVAFDFNSALGVQTIIFDIFKYNQFLNWF